MQIEHQLVLLAGSERSGALSGTWRNRLGSVMDLCIADDGAVSGTFRTGVGAPHPERTYPLTGYAHGASIAFCVDFAPHRSVAAWVGHHLNDDQGERLTTLYHLSRPVASPSSDADLWESVIAGADEFTRA